MLRFFAATIVLALYVATLVAAYALFRTARNGATTGG
jgi:hypothetical protein